MIDGITSQLIIDIITAEMDMKAGTIWIRDQNRKIPGDDQMYVIVGMVSTKPYSASAPYLKEKTVIVDGNPVVQTYEVNEAQVSETIQIDVLSRSKEAILKNWEVLAALNSILSKQTQEKNQVKFGRLPTSFVNTSLAEGGSQLNRYSLSFSCLVWYRKEKLLAPDGGDYYDDFDTRVDDEKTIGTPKGIIEFNISAEE